LHKASKKHPVYESKCTCRTRSHPIEHEGRVTHRPSALPPGFREVRAAIRKAIAYFPGEGLSLKEFVQETGAPRVCVLTRPLIRYPSPTLRE